MEKSIDDMIDGIVYKPINPHAHRVHNYIDIVIVIYKLNVLTKAGSPLPFAIFPPSDRGAIVQPRPSFKPRRLARSENYLLLTKGPFGKDNCCWRTMLNSMNNWCSRCSRQLQRCECAHVRMRIAN